MTTRRAFLQGMGLAVIGLACGDDDGVVDAGVDGGAADSGRADTGVDAGPIDGAVADTRRDTGADTRRDTGADTNADTNVDPVCNNVSASVAMNHRGTEHTLEVPLSDVLEGAERTYDITGFADHSHTLTVTTADFATLRTEGIVDVASTSFERHNHLTTLRCAA